MEVTFITKEQQKTSVWSGGTTTEIGIWPKGAVYADRDFDVRISSAVVELEESTFTQLPGYLRHLMILKGTLELQHDGGEWIKLAPYEVDVFDGGVNTFSKGRVTDFNVMLAEGYDASVSDVRVDAGQNQVGMLDVDFIEVLYCSEGSGELNFAQGQQRESFLINEGDALIIENGELDKTATDKAALDNRITFLANRGTEVVLVRVRINKNLQQM